MSKDESTALTTDRNDALDVLYPVLSKLVTLDEDPTPRMMQVMMDCASPAEWEDAFKARGLKESVGRKFRIRGVRASESNFKDSRSGWYLICDVVDLDSGEADVLTVGGNVAMAQVLGLVKHGNLPWDVQVVAKESPTRSGYTPINLVSLGRPVN